MKGDASADQRDAETPDEVIVNTGYQNPDQDPVHASVKNTFTEHVALVDYQPKSRAHLNTQSYIFH
ncbi:hypothetical protein [Pseudomonas fluorescens]|uniref:hypothetical protein n=1 Tax=Pseudomonas fluorescens TaxID=294 RepID=UPI00123EE23F|nr:hypothetical protein [Pseudomonas fluorescens]